MKKPIKKKKENSPPKIKPLAPTTDDKEDPFDFGGMPKRDLKKNLGCG